MAFETHWEAEGVYRRFYEDFSADDMKFSRAQVYGNPKFREMRYLINDYTDGRPDQTVGEQSVELAAALANNAAKLNPSIKFALVGSSPEVVELLDIFAALPISSEINYRIFPSLEEARSWVGG